MAKLINQGKFSEAAKVQQEIHKLMGTAHMTYLTEYNDYEYNEETEQYEMPTDFGYYYFAVTEEEAYWSDSGEKVTLVTICPSEYFDKTGYLWDSEMPIDNRLPKAFSAIMETVYKFDGIPELAEATCEALGLKRNQALDDFLAATAVKE
jgi:hypothetical protein